jgi:TnpA family transposase
MAQLTSNVTYEQLKRIGDWHLTEEAQRSALAELVSAITDLDTPARWGEGKTAASAGSASRCRAGPPTDLQHPIQRLRLGVLHLRGR